jgi:hypothetical protein
VVLFRLLEVVLVDFGLEIDEDVVDFKVLEVVLVVFLLDTDEDVVVLRLEVVVDDLVLDIDDVPRISLVSHG